MGWLMWSFAAVSRLDIPGRMPILKSVTTDVWQSERRRLRSGLAVLLLLVAQIAAAAHFIGHATQGEAADCNICLHAGQAGSALLPRQEKSASSRGGSSSSSSPVFAITSALGSENGHSASQ